MILAIDRSRIYIFVAITYAVSLGLGLVIYFNGGLMGNSPFTSTPLASLLMAGLMFVPLIANIVTRLVTREGWSNTLLRPNLRRGWRLYLAAWFLPVLAAIFGGAIYYQLFPARLDLSMTWAREVGLVTVGKDLGPGMFFVVQVGIALAAALTTGLFLCFGEEFGWRAYLLQKLMPLGGRKAVLLSGVIHGVWHWPYILMGYEYGLGYWGEPVVGPLLFLVFALCLSAFLAWVTLRSGSVWPAALGHAAVNLSPMLTTYYVRGAPDMLVGPITVGIVGMLGYALMALLIFFRPRALAPIANPEPAGPRGLGDAMKGAAI